MVQDKKEKFLGRHLFIEFWDCITPEDPKKWEELLFNAANAAKSTPLNFAAEKFEPQGVTAMLILAESHISVHTWPEKKYIAIDVFTCGDHTDPQAALEYLQNKLLPKKVESQLIYRGKTIEWKNDGK